jgi:hypothetical protein
MTSTEANTKIITPYEAQQAWKSATNVHDAAKRMGWIQGWIEAPWMQAVFDAARENPAPSPAGWPNDAEQQRSAAARLRLAEVAETIYRGLLEIPFDLRRRLMASVQGSGRLAMVREALKSFETGAEWLARADAREAAAAEAHAAAKARQDAEFEASQPAAILAAIESAGTTLALDRSGKNIVGTGAPVAPESLEKLRRHKDSLIVILAARAVAAAPRVLV